MKKHKKSLFLLVLLVVGSFSIQAIPKVKANAGWLTGYDYRMQHNITGASGAGSNYTMRFKVSYGSYPELTTASKEFQECDYMLNGSLIAGCGWEYTDNKTYISHDNGSTWNEIWDWNYSGIFYVPKNCRCVFVDSRNYIFLGGSYGTIFRSVDNGSTWTLVHNESGAEEKNEFWFMQEDSNGYLYVGLHAGYASQCPVIVKSTNNGGNWTNISDSGWGTGSTYDTNCLFLNPETDWLYMAHDGLASEKGIWRSKLKDGSDWYRVVPYDGIWRLSISAVDNETIFIGSEATGANKIGKFTDDGTNSTKPVTVVYNSTNSFPFIWAHWFNDTKELWFGAGRTHSGTYDVEIVRSIDNGTTWDIITSVQYLNSTVPDERREFYFSIANPQRFNAIFSTNVDGNTRIQFGDVGGNEENVYLNGKCQDDFGDIRFTDDDETTELDYWMDITQGNDENWRYFWVEVADNVSNNQTVYMYYGNSTVATTSNIYNTFVIADDFEECDLGRWTIDDDSDHTSSCASDRSFEKTYAYKGTEDGPIAGVARIIQNFTSQSTVEYQGVFQVNDTAGDIVVFLRGASGTTNRFRIRNDGGDLDYHTGSSWIGVYSGSIDTWYQWKIVYNNTNVDLYFYDEYGNELSSTEDITVFDSTGDVDNLRIQAFGSDVMEAWADIPRVRKWITTEPTHGDWGSEESLTIWNVFSVLNSKSTILSIRAISSNLQLLLSSAISVYSQKSPAIDLESLIGSVSQSDFINSIIWNLYSVLNPLNIVNGISFFYQTLNFFGSIIAENIISFTKGVSFSLQSLVASVSQVDFTRTLSFVLQSVLAVNVAINSIQAYVKNIFPVLNSLSTIISQKSFTMDLYFLINSISQSDFVKSLVWSLQSLLNPTNVINGISIFYETLTFYGSIISQAVINYQKSLVWNLQRLITSISTIESIKTIAFTIFTQITSIMAIDSFRQFLQNVLFLYGSIASLSTVLYQKAIQFNLQSIINTLLQLLYEKTIVWNVQSLLSSLTSIDGFIEFISATTLYLYGAIISTINILQGKSISWVVQSIVNSISTLSFTKTVIWSIQSSATASNIINGLASFYYTLNFYGQIISQATVSMQKTLVWNLRSLISTISQISGWTDLAPATEYATKGFVLATMIMTGAGALFIGVMVYTLRRRA